MLWMALDVRARASLPGQIAICVHQTGTVRIVTLSHGRVTYATDMADARRRLRVTAPGTGMEHAVNAVQRSTMAPIVRYFVTTF